MNQGSEHTRTCRTGKVSFGFPMCLYVRGWGGGNLQVYFSKLGCNLLTFFFFFYFLDTVGVRNFKVYRESEALKADADAK